MEESPGEESRLGRESVESEDKSALRLHSCEVELHKRSRGTEEETRGEVAARRPVEFGSTGMAASPSTLAERGEQRHTPP
jgi:hypothetical protein